MRLAVLGGTFNPPHLGHLRLLRTFDEKLDFDRVLIVPDRRPVHKVCEDLALDGDRVELCRRTFTGENCELSTMELDRESDSYTVYTVRVLRKTYPGAKLYLIIGSDMLLSFHKWYKYREIMENCTLCAAPRRREDSLKIMRSYLFSQFKIYLPAKESEQVILSDAEPFPISSTELRSRIGAGEDVSAYLTEGAYEYIRQRGLYGYKRRL